MKKNNNERQQENTIGNEPRLTNPDLWARIQDHHALLLRDEGYRSRLSAEAGVPAAGHGALVLEYLRFAYLAWTDPAGATPSKAVDEAWHTHILFTRSYAAFCEAAGAPYLHHQPGTGAAGEDARFRAAYHRTLDRYAAEFGPPPPTLWPDDRPPPPTAVMPRPAGPGGRAARAAGRALDALLLLAIPVAMLGASSKFLLHAEPWATAASMALGTAIGIPFAIMALSGPRGATGGAGAGSGKGSGGSTSDGGGGCGGIACAAASCSASCGGGGCGGGGCGS